MAIEPLQTSEVTLKLLNSCTSLEKAVTAAAALRNPFIKSEKGPAALRRSRDVVLASDSKHVFWIIFKSALVATIL